MKKTASAIIMLIFILLPVSAQKSKDVLYLKNGSRIYGMLLEVKDDQYKVRTSDGSIFIFSGSEIEKFVNEIPLFEGRKKQGAGFALEAGFLIGSQNTQYPAPFSFNFLGSYTANTRNLIGLGSGIEFIGQPYMPLFIEYKYLFTSKKTTPFIFARGGKLYHIGQDEGTTDVNNIYGPKNFKGGFSCAIGTGISWAKDDFETYLSFAYRYASTSYDQRDYTYKNSYNRLEVKFGFRF